MKKKIKLIKSLSNYKIIINFKHLYQADVKCIMYSMLQSKSELIYLIKKLSHYCFNLNVNHIKMFIHLIHYLQRILNNDVIFKTHFIKEKSKNRLSKIIKYINADYIKCLDTQKFILSYVFMFASKSIS